SGAHPAGPGEVIARVDDWDVVDAPTHPAFVPAWLGAATAAGPSRTRRPLGAGLDPARARVIGGEQSNTSIVIPVADDAAGGAILKVFRVVAAGPNPDVEVPVALAALDDGGGLVPQVLGLLE